MCFSASSSFTASILLTGIGCLAIKNNQQRSTTMIAMIPLLFGIQQACEGIVWLTIDNPTSSIHKIAAHAFLLFAIAIWPTWIPLSIAQHEHGIRKKIAYFLTGIGSCIAAYLCYKLIQEPTYAQQVKNSIVYHVGSIDPFTPTIALMIYAIPTIIPFFITTIPYGTIGGIATIASLIGAYYIRYETFGSVWCFFAALLSMFIVFSIDKMNKQKK